MLPCVCLDASMGCIESKEDKGPTMKYRPDSTPASDPSTATPHVGHYGPDPTQLQQNQSPPSSSGPAAGYNSHVITPFGGASAIMTPFGGASSSFSGPIPTVSGKPERVCVFLNTRVCVCPLSCSRHRPSSCALSGQATWMKTWTSKSCLVK